jgi:fermentation-respiration switch protein FrsA (DUF1100 family)
MGVRAYPFLPVRLLLQDRYETKLYLGQVRMPLLILHGERDLTVPVSMAHDLFRLGNGPKQLATLPRAGHSDIYTDGNNALDVLRGWIAGLKS